MKKISVSCDVTEAKVSMCGMPATVCKVWIERKPPIENKLMFEIRIGVTSYHVCEKHAELPLSQLVPLLLPREQVALVTASPMEIQ